MKKEKKIIPFPFPVYFWVMTVLLFGGLLVSIYLSISHYRIYTDMGYKSFCAISKSVNCDTVSQSPFSIFIGVPVPVWGIVGYLFFLMHMPLAWERESETRRMWSVFIVMATAYSVINISLAIISIFFIHSYCIMCIVNYGVTFVLLFYAWLIKKRFSKTGLKEGLRIDLNYMWLKKKVTIPVALSFALLILALMSSFPKYWTMTSPVLSAEIPRGITEEGHPWIGGEKPKLIITEFTDYKCFQCKKMHFYLRNLVAKHPDKIRLVHRHFPMDHEVNQIVKQPFHVGSGKLSLLAIYATEKGRFWEMNDTLFNFDPASDAINLREIAQKTGVGFFGLADSLKNKLIRKKLQIDIWKGMKLRITGTPGYLIDGEVYLANIPPEIIQNALK